MVENTVTPPGNLVIKTLAMPADANRYGDMFGGWLVSQMDLGGAIMAHRCSLLRMTTVAIDRLRFIKPVYIGDVVSCYANVVKRGRTSVGIEIEVWVQRHDDDSIDQVAESLFTFVAINQHGRPQAIAWNV